MLSVAHTTDFIFATCDFCLWSKKSAVCGNLKLTIFIASDLVLRSSMFGICFSLQETKNKNLLCAVCRDKNRGTRDLLSQ